MEVQTDDALNIVVRMFEYEAAQAVFTAGRELPPGASKKAEAEWVITFPLPLLLRWDTSEASPDTLTLQVKFSETDTYTYKVPVFKLLKYSVQDLEAKSLLILLPFCVLKLRQRVKDVRTTEERQELAVQMRSLVDELLAALERGEQAGYLLAGDMPDIMDCMDQLLRELYHPYIEFTEVRAMVKGIYELRTDKLRKELATATQNAEEARRNVEKAERNAETERRNREDAEQTLQNLEDLGVPHELIERARNNAESQTRRTM